MNLGRKRVWTFENDPFQDLIYPPDLSPTRGLQLQWEPCELCHSEDKNSYYCSSCLAFVCMFCSATPDNRCPVCHVEWDDSDWILPYDSESEPDFPSAQDPDDQRIGGFPE